MAQVPLYGVYANYAILPFMSGLKSSSCIGNAKVELGILKHVDRNMCKQTVALHSFTILEYKSR